MGRSYRYFPRTLGLEGQIRREGRARTFSCARARGLLLVDLAGSSALQVLDPLQLIEDLHRL